MIVLWALGAVSLLAIWLVAYGFFFSELQEAHSQHNLYGTFREQLASGTAPLSAPIRDDKPVALISAPQAGLHNAVVVQGTAPGDLENGPGHRSDSVLPGQVGVSVLYGRGVTFGGPFRHVASLTAGDVITVTTGQGIATYLVDDVRVAGDPFPAPLAQGGSRLVLESSVARGYRSEWAPTESVYVDADLRGTPFPAGATGPYTPAQRAMVVDKSALQPLVLWLQAFFVIDIVFVWARSKWGAPQTWLVGAPLLLAVMWEVTSVAARLVPNLF
jgi:sortase A